MAEESEKRFHAIMDKLFHAPPKSKSKSKSTTPTLTGSTSLSGVQQLRGKKCPNTMSVWEPKLRGDIVGGLHHSTVSSGSVQTPVCRPWDRGDLMRRLATFKSMKWFAKPQVVSAVNCARRGWVNVDVDTIACEACGSLEKAALVFSLKLDNGHKLLCPWIDNACDEQLAQFPPTPAVVLVDEYKKRSSVLLNLLALPVISSSAIDYMRSPQLEHFLRGSSIVGGSIEPADTSQVESLGNEDSDSSVSYYQAQKIISLCGWEPRSLPYIVDCKDQQYKSTKDGNLSDLSRGVSNGINSSIVIHSSGIIETMEENDNPVASDGVLSDPNSVVLDCRLCGASVGLWTFSIVPRPLEFVRLVGCTEVNGEHDSSHHKDDANPGETGASGTHVLGIVNHVETREGTCNTVSTSATSSSERRLNLNLTIAGGPLPAKQNFRATISLPVIGQNLRARISSDPDFRDRLCVNNSCEGGKSHMANTLTGHGFQPEDMELLHSKVDDDGQSNSMINELSSCLNDDINEQGDTLGIEVNCDIASEGAKSKLQEYSATSIPDSDMEIPMESSPNLVNGFSEKGKMPENVENIAQGNPEVRVASSSEVGDSSLKTTGVHVTSRTGEIVEDDFPMTVKANSSYLQPNPVTDTVCGIVVDTSGGSGVDATVHPVNNNVVPWSIGKNKDQPPLDKAMEFDPIRQHRHFCPWIASTGNSAPGWQQVLSALQRQNEFLCPLSTKAPSSSLIEVDDPVASVKKLFTPPSAKRIKLTPGSS
ncbi:Nuclear-interacting partner of ALK like [Actinidia chinensis var. chinensis]|uniref:Nuclear-interacting partner of ALK like n=1 Tax=Actinidia chinensis var. chinensis TaxID=1590841 RepID=A0A2R6QI53_ACTCC|nr:Nuclear-interacting partner of ALK like [Actinidia chinensis var. chinensis]